MPTAKPVIAILWGLALAVAALPAAAADKPPEQVSLFVGYSPGGSFDAYARPVGKYLGKYLPGHPNVVMKYMAGAGSRKAAGYIFNVAKKDGSEIGFIHRSAIFDELLLGTRDEFEARKFSFIGGVVRERLVCFTWFQAKAQNVEQAKAETVLMGTTDPKGGDVLVMKLINRVAGTKFKPVSGYPGGTELNLALERREIDGRCQSWNSIKATRGDWLQEKKLTVLIQASPGKNTELPQVPSILDIAPTDQDRAAIKLAFAEQEMGNPFIAPPGVAPEVLKTLRDAFAQVMKDPEFLADAKATKIDVEPVPGEEMQQIIENAFNAPAPILTRAKELIAD
jgi:tripartite-type tricarboxylate transporter receptor subunit TctC